MNKKQALIAGLMAFFLCGTVAAQQIPFFGAQFETTAIALTSDGPAGFETHAGALGNDTAFASADSIGTVDVSTAGAIVGPGLLSTSVDVSAADLSNAVASAHFTGSFINGGAVSLNIDFSALTFASGTGEASTTLFVSLISNGVMLFEDYVQGPWQFSYAPLVGSTSVLDLTLSSDASVAFLGSGAGNASSVGLVSVTGVVPEASTWLMFVLGLSGVALLVSARTRAQRSGS